MAKENVKKFYKELSENKQLQEKLAKAQESYAGDPNDRQAAVETIFLPIAQEAGFDFTAEELKAAEREQMNAQGISEEELENVNGGGGFCFFIGSGTDVSAEKKGSGAIPVAHACAYIGFGVDVW